MASVFHGVCFSFLLTLVILVPCFCFQRCFPMCNHACIDPMFPSCLAFPNYASPVFFPACCCILRVSAVYPSSLIMTWHAMYSQFRSSLLVWVLVLFIVLMCCVLHFTLTPSSLMVPGCQRERQADNTSRSSVMLPELVINTIIMLSMCCRKLAAFTQVSSLLKSE